MATPHLSEYSRVLISQGISVELLFGVLDCAAEAVVLVDRNWQMLYFNGPAARINSELIEGPAGQTIWRAWPEFATNDTKGKCQSAMDTGESIQFDFRQTDFKQEKWLACRAVPIPTGLVLYFSDIITPAISPGNHSLLDSIIEGTPDPIFARDLDGRFVLANSAAAKLLGVSRQELIGKRSSDFSSETFAGTTAEADRRVMNTGETEVVEEWLLEGERRCLYLSTRSAWRNSAGEIIGIIGVARDITSRKEVEDALHASQDRLHLALTAGQMGTWDHDLSTGTLVWSDGHFRLWGLEPGACRPTMETFRSRLHPADVIHVRDVVQTAVETGSAYTMQYRVIWPDESVHWIEARGKVVSEHGMPVRTIGVVIDHTLRKRTEDKLRESARLESLGILAGGVAHDFNNLLTGILGNASLMQDLLPNGSPLAGPVDQIFFASQRAAELTRQMLAYSGKGSFVIQSLDLSLEVAQIVPLLQSSIGSNVELRMDLSHNLPGIAADPAQIQQLIMNLGINAAEAIGLKSGTVALSTELIEVDAHYARDILDAYEIPAGRYVRLEVRDTGHGMDEAILGKIFDPFFSTKFTGRGLGLAAVQGIVRGLKGALTVRSAPGQGTTFQLYFPPVRPMPEPPQYKVGSTSAKRGGHGVLVVDDETVVHEIARNALESEGYRVHIARNGKEAIKVLKELPGEIELVVLDLTMPMMGGEEALPELKSLCPNVVILASSGHPELEALQRFGSTVEGFLQKPYTARTLVERVASLLPAIRPGGLNLTR